MIFRPQIRANREVITAIVAVSKYFELGCPLMKKSTIVIPNVNSHEYTQINSTISTKVVDFLSTGSLLVAFDSGFRFKWDQAAAAANSVSAAKARQIGNAIRFCVVSVTAAKIAVTAADMTTMIEAKTRLGNSLLLRRNQAGSRLDWSVSDISICKRQFYLTSNQTKSTNSTLPNDISMSRVVVSPNNRRPMHPRSIKGETHNQQRRLWASAKAGISSSPAPQTESLPDFLLPRRS